MIADKIYNELSDEVYNLDPIKNPDLNKQLKKDDTINIGNDKFLVLSAEGNSATPTDNGMQAMAVAPIKGYDAENKPIADTSQIVIAYAGMNGNERFRTKPFLV